MDMALASGARFRCGKARLSARPFGRGRHQVNDRIDDAPGDVAPYRRKQDVPDSRALAQCHTDRAGKGQRHEQAEHDLGQPIDRIKWPVRPPSPSPPISPPPQCLVPCSRSPRQQMSPSPLAHPTRRR